MYSAVPTTSASAVLIQVPTPAQTSAAVNTATPAHVQPVGGGFLGDGIKLFLKGQPKALGVVQIMIGVLNLLFGIVLAVAEPLVISGHPFWASIIYIITGSLCVAAENRADSNAKLCLVRGSLGMNITSAVTAGIGIITTSVNLILRPWMTAYGNNYYNCYDCSFAEKYSRLSAGVHGVLLVFSVLELITSICLAGFSCNVGCCSSPQYVPHVVVQPSCPPPSHLYPNPNSEIFMDNTSWKNENPGDGLPPYSS